jgi:hypothetical protein
MWKIQAQDSDLPRRRVVLSSLALIILLDKKPGFLEEAKEAFCALIRAEATLFLLCTFLKLKNNACSNMMLGRG